MLFIFSTPVFIRHMWKLKTIVFLHWCLIHAFLLILIFMCILSMFCNRKIIKKYQFFKNFTMQDSQDGNLLYFLSTFKTIFPLYSYSGATTLSTMTFSANAKYCQAECPNLVHFAECRSAPHSHYIPKSFMSVTPDSNLAFPAESNFGGKKCRRTLSGSRREFFASPSRCPASA